MIAEFEQTSTDLPTLRKTLEEQIQLAQDLVAFAAKRASG
jgi:hypothetical protein